MYDEYSEKQKEREKEWGLKKRSIDEDLDKKEPKHHTKSHHKKSRRSSSTWVRPRLRVRIIDKKSKYYKEKVVVNDVISHDTIECITPSGKILDNVDPYDVETVIPKNEDSLVLIVNTKHQGKVAKLLGKDAKKEMVTVQTWPDQEHVLSLGYDGICELTGGEDNY